MSFRTEGFTVIIGTSHTMIYVLAGSLSLLLGLVVALGYFAMQRNSTSASYDKQLAELIEDERDDVELKPSIGERWNRYWAERFKIAGVGKPTDDESKPGRDIIVAWFLLLVAISFFLKSVIIGVVISTIIIYIAGVVMKTRGNRKIDALNAQLPGFLFALKANIQANETPERAILKVADNMPSPLYEDLIVVKQRILANISFKDALQELSDKTASRDLRFLCACMIQASGSGANIESQITIIQGVLDARRRVSGELEKAVRSAAPAIWVASFIIPAVFIATLLMDPASNEFWFKNPLSWAAMGAVAMLYGFGVFMSKKLVDSIKNL